MTETHVGVVWHLLDSNVHMIDCLVVVDARSVAVRRLSWCVRLLLLSQNFHL